MGELLEGAVELLETRRDFLGRGFGIGLGVEGRIGGGLVVQADFGGFG